MTQDEYAKFVKEIGDLFAQINAVEEAEHRNQNTETVDERKK